MKYAAIDQLLYVHCACGIDDIFTHLRLVRDDRSIVEYYTSSIEGIAERLRMKEVCDCGGHVRTVPVCFLKAYPGFVRTHY